MPTRPQETGSPSIGEADDRSSLYPAPRSRGLLTRPAAEGVWKYTLFGVLALSAAVLVYQNLPDLIRYFKMRSM